MTKIAFLEAYRLQLLAQYAWAEDRAKLDAMMEACRNAINGVKRGWRSNGDAAKAAWKDIGGSVRQSGLTMKALQLLPNT